MGDVTVTTTDAAAAWHVHMRLTLAAIISIAALGLSGCGTSSLLGGGGESSSSILGDASSASKPAAAQTRVTIAPIVGAPEAVGRQLSAQLTSAAEQKGIAIAKSPGEASDYTLRGYMVAAKERSGIKVSYIWDLTDTQGKRVNRYQGEEVVPGGDNRDPWASITAQVMSTIADKTASGLSNALANAPKGGGAAPPVGVGASDDSMRVASAPATSGATGSINKAGGVTAVVPAVVGAPGDGKTALAEALRSELSRSGITVAENAAPGAFRIEGRVAMGQATSGKQPIQIDWQVKDPAGKRLGTVSQKNEIPQGSLDGAWGQTADAAAAAAAQGIVKLLPGQKGTN
jgi:hypothetical protein